MVILSVIPFSGPIFIVHVKSFLVDGKFLHEQHEGLHFYYDTWLEQLTLN